LKQVRFNDIIKRGSEGALKKQIETALYTKYIQKTNAPPDKDLAQTSIGFFENSVDVPEQNFFVSPQGLGFAWAAYMIAPYVYGIIEIELPYDTIKEFLTPYGEYVLQIAGQ
jgi:hypothetical protein